MNVFTITFNQVHASIDLQTLVFIFIGPPPMNGMDEPLSSASIFEHVDRMSRPVDGPKRLPNKIQLIAMQPMPALPLPNATANDRAAENVKLNKEVPSVNLIYIHFSRHFLGGPFSIFMAALILNLIHSISNNQ